MTRQFSMKLTNLGKTEFATDVTEDSSTNFDTRRTIVEITGSDGSHAVAQVDRNKNNFAIDLLSSEKYPTIGPTNISHTVKTTSMVITGTGSGGGTVDPDPDPDPDTGGGHTIDNANLILDMALTQNMQDVSTNIKGSAGVSNFVATFLNTTDSSSVGDPVYSADGLDITETQRLLVGFNNDINTLNWSSDYRFEFDVSIITMSLPTFVVTDETAGLAVLMERNSGDSTVFFAICDFPYINATDSFVTVPDTGKYKVEIARRGYALYLSVTSGGVRKTTGWAFPMVNSQGSLPFGTTLSFNARVFRNELMGRMHFRLANLKLYDFDKINFKAPLIDAQYIFSDVETGRLNLTSAGITDYTSTSMTASSVGYGSDIPAPIMTVIPFEGTSTEARERYWFIMMDHAKFALGMSELLSAPSFVTEYNFHYGASTGHKYNYSTMTHSNGEKYWIFDVFADSDETNIGASGAIYIMKESTPTVITAFYETALEGAYSRTNSPRTNDYPETTPTRTVCMKQFSDGLGVLELMCYRDIASGTDKIKLTNYLIGAGTLVQVSSVFMTLPGSRSYNFSAIAIGFQGSMFHMVVGRNEYAQPDQDNMTLFTKSISEITSMNFDLTTLPDLALDQPFVDSKSTYMQCTDSLRHNAEGDMVNVVTAASVTWPETTYYGHVFRDQWVVTSRNGAGALIAMSYNPNNELLTDGDEMPSFYADLENFYNRKPSSVTQVGAYGSDILQAVDGHYVLFFHHNTMYNGVTGTMMTEYEISQPVVGFSMWSDVSENTLYISMMDADASLTPRFCKKISGRTNIPPFGAAA